MATNWEEEEIDLRQISRLYEETAGNWLLLDILETNANGTPTRMRLIAKKTDKSELHDLIMDDDDREWENNYLLVFADPNKPCTIR